MESARWRLRPGVKGSPDSFSSLLFLSNTEDEPGVACGSYFGGKVLMTHCLWHQEVSVRSFRVAELGFTDLAPSLGCGPRTSKSEGKWLAFP
jgi:hypothetical protein